MLAKGIEARIDKEPNKIHGTMPLRDDVKQLSRGVFKRLLASDALQLQLENEAYSLMLTWLRRSPHVPDDAQRLAFFKELAPLLRYHHMTPDFLANVVSVCNMMNKSDLLLSVLRSTFVHREASQSILEKEKVERVGGDRGIVPFEASWELKASYTLREMAVLQLGCWMKMWCGLIAGYLAGLSLQRWKGDGKETLGAFFWIDMPVCPSPLVGGLRPGVTMKRNGLSLLTLTRLSA